MSSRGKQEIRRFVSRLSEVERQHLVYYWPFWARPKQLPPEGDWKFWVLFCGRGWGKSLTAAQWIRDRVESGVAKRIALVARTPADARDVMIEGESGLLSSSVAPPWFRPRYEPTKRRLTWPRPKSRGVGRIVVGSEATTATVYSAQEPKNLRGPQHDTAWCEEIAHWESREAFEQLSLGLRTGRNPQCVVTSTPVPRPLVYELRDSKRSVVTYGSTYENLENLADSYEEIIERFRGTRIERQELYGEILQALEGALVTYEHLTDSRMLDDLPPPFHRCVVAVDPAASSHEKADETGIVTVGADKGGHGYVQDDWSCRGSPDEWAKRAIQLYNERAADAIVAERNNGGEMVQDVIRTRAPEIPVRLVWASRGKNVRFSPVAALYAQRRIHHLGVFPELEGQLTAWDVDGYQGEGSPDRAEAVAWGISHLLVTRKRKTAGVFGGARLRREERESA